MDSKTKLLKPSGLKLPQIFSKPKPLSSKINLPNVPIVKHDLRTTFRRSKSMSDMRPINEKPQFHKFPLKPRTVPANAPTKTDTMKPRMEPATAPTKTDATNSSQVRAPVKRPACPKTDDSSKPKNAKQTRPAKIPNWDYKTRYQQLSEKYDKVVESFQAAKSQLGDFDQMKRDLEIKSVRLVELQAIDSEKSIKLEKLTHVESDLQELQKKHEILEKLQLEQSKELQKLHHVETDLSNLRQKYEILQHSEREKSNRLEILSHVESDLKELTSKFESLSKEASTLRQKVIDAELMRRKFHNTIQDLKGNIRVFCRVRPPISDAEIVKPQCMINYLDESTIEIGKIKESIGSTGKLTETKADFVFDRIFSPDCSQSEFFEELSLLVQSAMDGYNVCVFAYGQTGSGKTYTMQGEMTPEHLGMIPRSVNLIFETIQTLAETNWKYTVKVSFLEIYNDNVRDLLHPNGTHNLEICHNEGRGTTVTNLITHQISSPQDFQDLMTIALKHRVVAATNFNELSSRSHAITKIYLNGVNTNAGVSYSGSISLVDLAGSESAKFSCPERMNETKSINKSLTALGTVMLALYNKNAHIPYRNSKLTFLLQSCLGGSSKTLMIVNIPPFEENFSESLTSLRFASKVKEVKNTLKKNRPV